MVDGKVVFFVKCKPLITYTSSSFLNSFKLVKGLVYSVGISLSDDGSINISHLRSRFFSRCLKTFKKSPAHFYRYTPRRKIRELNKMGYMLNNTKHVFIESTNDIYGSDRIIIDIPKEEVERYFAGIVSEADVIIDGISFSCLFDPFLNTDSTGSYTTDESYSKHFQMFTYEINYINNKNIEYVFVNSNSNGGTNSTMVSLKVSL